MQSTPPPPSDPTEIRRIEHTRLRRRLLYSEHEQDLNELMERQLGTIRREAWGAPDMTANPFLSLWEQSARMYGVAPDVEHPDAAGQELAALIADTGYWALMQRVQRDTLALREMVMRIDVVDGGLVFRPVFPDLVEASAHPRRPDTPTTLAEWEHIPEFGWVRRSASIVGQPHYSATASIDGQDVDVTADVIGSGLPIDASGAPSIPYVVFHAAECGWLFDAFSNREIVEGSLIIGVLLTFYQHICRTSAFSQRYAAGVLVEGVGTEANGGEAARQEIVTDPATLLMLAVREGSSPLIGQWAPSADPEALLRSISMYERRIMTNAGLMPQDVTRQSADVRSGYSLAVARESVRDMQRLHEPQFRRGDLAVIRAAAIALNSAGLGSYPEDGYTITYRGLPPSPVEDRVKLDAVMGMIEKGVLTPEEGRERLSDVIARL